MNRIDSAAVRWASHAAVASGIAYAVLRYALAPADEFAVGHPFEPAARDAHVLATPLLVLALGMTLRSHALPMLRRRRAAKRRSGIGLLACALPIIGSGYLIQVAVDDAFRFGSVAVHLGASGVWIVACVAHRFFWSRTAASDA